MKKIIVFLAVAAFACSCSDFLDVKPVGKLIPEKVADIDNLLNNQSTLSNMFYDNNNGNFLAFLGDNLRISDNEAKFRYTAGSVNLDRYAAYTFYQPYQDPRAAQYTWDNGIYRAAGIFNSIVEGIAALPAAESDTEYARSVVAQARTARAWAYLVGGLCYGPMWNPNGANNKSSNITYRTASEPSVANPNLSTTEELFAQVFADLEYGLAHAPELVSNPCRANKAAVKAILAEFYMYKRDWANMLKYADEAWESTLEQRGGDYNQLIHDYNYWTYGDFTPGEPTEPSNEIYYSIQGAPAGFNQTWSAENLLYRMAPNSISAKSYPSQEYIDLFTEDDIRRQLFMLRDNGWASGTNKDGIQLYMYRDEQLSVYTTTDSRNEGITFPILLLMRAEAWLRTGEKGKALADLNMLRSCRYDYAYAFNTDLPNGESLSDDELMVEILRERRLEQPIASFQRILDLKRFVYDTGKPWCKTSITHTVNGAAHTAEINDTFFTLKPSNEVINLNPHWGLKADDTPWTPAG